MKQFVMVPATDSIACVHVAPGKRLLPDFRIALVPLVAPCPIETESTTAAIFDDDCALLNGLVPEGVAGR